MCPTHVQALDITVRRLGSDDASLAKAQFALMQEVFEAEATALSDLYVAGLLADQRCWIVAATVEGELVGGLTAHVLPMTRAETAELFIYDIAVRADSQRRGVGRALLAHTRALADAAGLANAFVLAENADKHALAFYRALGGEAARVSMFTYAGRGPSIQG